MFIELHMIQNFSPSNLNRDDTNNPKDCEFGGHRRARISSQSLKRAIRFEPIFAETTKVAVGERSKWMSRPIRDKLVAAGKEEAMATAVAVAFVSDYVAKSDKKNPERPTSSSITPTLRFRRSPMACWPIGTRLLSLRKKRRPCQTWSRRYRRKPKTARALLMLPSLVEC